MATTSAREMPVMGASMGEQMEESVSLASVVSVARSGVSTMSHAEVAQLEPPLT